MKLSKIKLKDIVSPKRWGMFIVGMYLGKLKPFLQKLEKWVLKKLGHSTEGFSELEIAYNIVYRTLRCGNCVKRGYCEGDKNCKGCGCSAPENMLVSSNKCECKKWGTFDKNIIEHINTHFDLLLIPKKVETKRSQVLSQEEINNL